MADPDQPKFAHFEGVKETSIYHLYGQHDEVARQIHQDALRRFTGNDTLTVDLVEESPIVPESMETLDHLQEYDSVSVSSGVGLGSILFGGGIAGGELTNEYKRRFAEEDMPVYVVAAGNEGESNQVAMPRVADFARNSLIVGEANNNNGAPFVEKHSSRLNPTLSSDSPFNRGEAYQYYDTSPSLEGHEDLVRKWVIDKQVQIGIDLFKEQNKGLDEGSINEGVGKIYYALHEKYENNADDIAWVDGQVQAYMENPEALHEQVMAELREHTDIDENGYVTGINGTSFSAPEQAGYISGALYEQWEREEQNLPILTKDEITTLAKMATIDVSAREGVDEPMGSYVNADGHEFVSGGGHGMFNPDMFRSLIDEAYNKIGSDPDIDRESVTVVMSADIKEGLRGDKDVTLGNPTSRGQDVVVDRMRLDIDYDVDGTVPHHALIDKAGQGDVTVVRLQEANTRGTFHGWARIEKDFGETMPGGKDWSVRLHNGNDATHQGAQLTVYGYNEGGLMDQMMDYSKTLAAEMAPKPDAAPEVEVVPDIVPAVSGSEATPIKGP
ncbi:MAG: hypothetical protein ACTHOO_11830 [Alcanivorax sp.]